MIRLKLDLQKFHGAKPFTAKDGTEFIAIPVAANNIHVGQKGTYLDLTLMDNRDGRDKFDNDGFCTVDVGKERRLAGEKGPIVGNWKDLDGGNQRGGRDIAAKDATYRGNRSAPQQRDNSATEPDDDDGTIPFAPLVNITHF
jgi:hypothetical protein